MAIRHAEPNASNPRRAWIVATSLVVLFVVALFLRAYWNLDAANPSEGEFLLSGGSDPYYHKHAVDAILTDTGEGKFRTLIDDPLLNYPYGSINPNPPLFQWTAAVLGSMLAPFFSGETSPTGEVLSAEAVSTWWVFLWLPAILGALSLIPIYFIGKTLFDWRVGLVAALFWTVSTSAIDATGLGLSDHDAMLMFFALFAFLFYTKMITEFRGAGNYVANWRDSATVTGGIGRIFRERRLGMAYALLTGVSIGAVALVWKGFPYVIGIMFAYAVVQLVVDHWRNRDSTAIFLGTAIAMIVGTLMAYPYYAVAGLSNFISPVFFIIGALIAIAIVLIPTRDLPSILVFPAAVLVALVAGLAALFVFPNVAQKLLFATVYFKQSTLYTTIAEAHPADFATISFGIGPLPFFAALLGWIVVLAGLRKNPARAHLFAVIWGAIAFYMATSAVRFLFNAIPVFAVFGAFMTVWLVDWLDFSTIKKHLAGTGGWAGFRKGLRPLHVVGVLVLALFLVIPNAMLAADAALPRQEEFDIAENSGDFVQDFVLKRFGAYGQSYLDPDWQSALAWLDDHDASIQDPADRPAFLSWWDYGHWAISVGNHPAVADNFQNGYEYAANFLLAQNETEAVQLLAARMLPLLDEAQGRQIVADAGADDANAAYDALLKWEYVDSLTLDESVAMLLATEAATGKKIRYFATDIRMMPLDDPNTPSVATSSASSFQEQSSIFYAPVILAQEEPDAYVPFKVNVGNEWITQDEFNARASDPIRLVQATAERLEYEDAFLNSMYYRGFVGTPVNADPTGPVLGLSVYESLACALPGYGLQHFRLVYANSGVKMLEFTPGATVTGTVTEDGQPLSDVTVTAYDAGGIVQRPGACPTTTTRTGGVPHGSTTTDATGAFSLTAPFALDGEEITLVVERAGVELGRANVTGITREAADQQQSFTADITVEKGAVEAFLFHDVNGDRIFQATNDTILSGLNVTVADVRGITGTDGFVNLTDVSAGRQTVTVDSERYEIVAGQTVDVRPGANATHVDIAVREKSGTLNGTLAEDAMDGAGLESVQIVFEPTDLAGNTAQVASATTGANGTFEVDLRPGEYRLNVTGYSITPEIIVIEAAQTVEQTFVAVRES